MQRISWELKQLQIIRSEGNSELHGGMGHSECFVTDIAYDGSIPKDKTLKLNPVVQNILVCQFSGRPSPSFKWKSDQKGVINSAEKTLYIEADSRRDGYAEIITCEVNIGKPDAEFYSDKNVSV